MKVPIPAAIEVFVGGFTFTRSLTHPYLGERIDSLWVMRDAPRKGGRFRREEWVAFETDPETVHRIVQSHTRGHYAICAMCSATESDSSLRSGYKALGYRLQSTEALMVHNLKRILNPTSPASNVRVSTSEMAEQLGIATRSRPLRDEFLVRDSPLCQYVALIDQEIVGNVRSITVGNSTWCADMFVNPEFRRRGIGRSLLCHMLRDQRSKGAKSAVLLASHAGAKLYPTAGYQEIATLLFYNQPKRRAS